MIMVKNEVIGDLNLIKEEKWLHMTASFQNTYTEQKLTKFVHFQNSRKFRPSIKQFPGIPATIFLDGGFLGIPELEWHFLAITVSKQKIDFLWCKVILYSTYGGGGESKNVPRSGYCWSATGELSYENGK